MSFPSDWGNRLAETFPGWAVLDKHGSIRVERIPFAVSVGSNPSASDRARVIVHWAPEGMGGSTSPHQHLRTWDFDIDDAKYERVLAQARALVGLATGPTLDPFRIACDLSPIIANHIAATAQGSHAALSLIDTLETALKNLAGGSRFRRPDPPAEKAKPQAATIVDRLMEKPTLLAAVLRELRHRAPKLAEPWDEGITDGLPSFRRRDPVRGDNLALVTSGDGSAYSAVFPNVHNIGAAGGFPSDQHAMAHADQRLTEEGFLLLGTNYVSNIAPIARPWTGKADRFYRYDAHGYELAHVYPDTGRWDAHVRGQQTRRRFQTADDAKNAADKILTTLHFRLEP